MQFLTYLEQGGRPPSGSPFPSPCLLGWEEVGFHSGLGVAPDYLRERSVLDIESKGCVRALGFGRGVGSMGYVPDLGRAVGPMGFEEEIRFLVALRRFPFGLFGRRSSVCQLLPCPVLRVRAWY